MLHVIQIGRLRRCRILGRLIRLESLPDHPLLEQLAPCSLKVVRKEEDRLRGRLHLGTGIGGEAFGPAPQLSDLPIVHRVASSPARRAGATPNQAPMTSGRQRAQSEAAVELV